MPTSCSPLSTLERRCIYSIFLTALNLLNLHCFRWKFCESSLKLSDSFLLFGLKNLFWTVPDILCCGQPTRLYPLKWLSGIVRAAFTSAKPKVSWAQNDFLLCFCNWLCASICHGRAKLHRNCASWVWNTLAWAWFTLQKHHQRTQSWQCTCWHQSNALDSSCWHWCSYALSSGIFYEDAAVQISPRYYFAVGKGCPPQHLELHWTFQWSVWSDAWKRLLTSTFGLSWTGSGSFTMRGETSLWEQFLIFSFNCWWWQLPKASVRYAVSHADLYYMFFRTKAQFRPILSFFLRLCSIPFKSEL